MTRRDIEDIARALRGVKIEELTTGRSAMRRVVNAIARELALKTAFFDEAAFVSFVMEEDDNATPLRRPDLPRGGPRSPVRRRQA
jgi:hypothetical protein